ncbi:mechanosensitive ion channel domain-containing protein [Salidesulfovibrio brasiliensis]|uniref:mechanosensitive ion channel domain-containing protein n=1 Tax=Salidesulfovibrio brasiliensis TaxID=221711 RepID=UPI0006D29E2D|nr:mechanosensitive ion channel domain-containing protein [Salidesulfovibrio brasiliensis]
MKSFRCLAVAFLLILVATPSFATSSLPFVPGKKQAKETVEVAEQKGIPDDISAKDLKEVLAAMTDDQVRRLLIEELDQRSQAQQAAPDKTQKKNAIASFIERMRRAGDFVRDRFMYLFSGADEAPRAMPEAVERVFGLDRQVHPLTALVGVGLLTVLYWLAGWAVNRRTRNLRDRLAQTPENPEWYVRMGRLFLRALLDLMTLLLISTVVFIVYLLLVGQYSGAKPVVITWLAAMIFWGLSTTVARFLLAPKAPGLRFLPIPDTAAKYLYKWADRFALLIALSLLFFGLLRLEDSSEALHLLTLACIGFVLMAAMCVLLIANRKPVADYIRHHAEQGSIGEQFAPVWHLAAITYLLVFWVVWVLGMILFGESQAWNGLAALLCVPAYLILNWGAQRLVDHAGHMAGKHDDAARVSRVKTVLRAGFRVGIGAALFFWLLSLYDLSLPLGEATARALINVMVTLVLAYLFWLYVSSAIERRIKPEGEEHEDDDAEGGHGGDRITTLLQLLKKFIFTALVVVVALICLSSIGVDIGPLLAGASIFGIAIGFGSQTLVKDIVSGIFFLLDDAIRVGDYIEVDKARGTVERISIRSMQLRHHLGMVYTIPFGHIKQVKNLTRDYSIMKLQYHVPFDTDVGKVKKIVKRIDKELRQIPEFDNVLLSKIKSQGVKSMDEVGMLMRIKFTTKPGGQFSVRKAVLTKLKKYFEEEGLHFAHRKVTVHVATDGELDREEAVKAGAGAAQQMLSEEEKAKQSGSNEER